jgi:hypothetical protein
MDISLSSGTTIPSKMRSQDNLVIQGGCMLHQESSHHAYLLAFGVAHRRNLLHIQNKIWERMLHSCLRNARKLSIDAMRKITPRPRTVNTPTIKSSTGTDDLPK